MVAAVSRWEAIEVAQANGWHGGAENMKIAEIIGILVIAFVIFRGVYAIADRSIRAQSALRKAETEQPKKGENNDKS